MQSTDLAINDAVGEVRAAGRRADVGTLPDQTGGVGRGGPAATVAGSGVAAARAVDVAALQRLGVELVARGYQTHLVTPGDRPPHLDVVNPRVRAMAETVYTQGGCFWWGWAERIVRDDDAAAAGAVIARVLRTVDD